MVTVIGKCVRGWLWSNANKMYHIFIGHSHLSGGEHDVSKLIAQHSYQKDLLTTGAVFEKFLFFFF